MSNAPPTPTSQACDTPAAFIRANRDNLIQKWLARVRREIPAAQDHSDDEVIDNLPPYLVCMANLLERPGDPRHLQELQQFCHIHAEQRSQLSRYTLEDVMTEHHILRDVCFVDLMQHVQLSTDQARVVSQTIFQGVLESSAVFSSLLLQKHESAIRNLEAERENREHLVTSLTHDLRQPLQIIRINAQILQREGDRDKQFRFINKIIEHSERAAHMLDDLLDANRLRAGEKLRLNIEEVDLRKLAQDVAGEMATSYGDRFSCDCDQPVIGYWDAAKLRRAIENLVINAVKYGWQNTPITISVRDYGPNVECSVHNVGDPIPPDQIGFLFDQYYRAPVAKRTGSKGWGVGLALVKGIAEAHGGAASVTSSEKDGTTFTITLPKDAREK
ncbi:MAG TPA: HAMP domain-containing sensor histidine kinase [Planctomycetota bacterium]|nr:HAMP domain-containing sensor histidine kinase [Planctomycetota bacterium]